MDSVAVRQLEGSVPGTERSIRSMLALAPPEGLAPAKGFPTPSSASSRTAPVASRSRRSSLVLGRLMAEVWSQGSSASREDAAGKMLMTRAPPAGRIMSGANETMAASSPVLFRLVSDQPARSQSDVPAHAISTHSSDAERSDPIHITSLMMTDALSASARTRCAARPESVQSRTLAGRSQRWRAKNRKGHYSRGK